MTRKLASLGLCGLLLVALTACNTAQGFGRDMEKAGQSIQKTF
jgi:predicted small secreted protein